nr:hypothetical protein B0A51_13610 [Rachicladosporium sp. CCFEE 5018]
MALPTRGKPSAVAPTPKFVANPVYVDKFKQLKGMTKLPDTKYAACQDGQTDARFLKDKPEFSVITNYVAIDKTPTKLYEYSVQYADIPMPSATPSGPARSRQITQASQKRLIFRALSGLDSSPLHQKHDWATDYTMLWSRTQLSYTTVSNLSYIKQGGSSLTIPSVTFTFQRAYDFPAGKTPDSKALNKSIAGVPTDSHNPTQIITALNALLTQHVKDAVGDDALVQVGTNKFYIPGSVRESDGIHILRGYFSSVRPGSTQALLNINPTHAAFFPPILVSDFLRLAGTTPMDVYGDPKQYLRGRIVRITYERPEDDNNPNRNAEESRRKTIASFGLPPSKQTFDVGTKTWTVKEWFVAQGASNISDEFGCVNVGLKPRLVVSANGTTQPSQGGELWIPAQYLELEPHQPFTKKLGERHMSLMHAIALRHPGANQASLVLEGLPAMGIGSSTAAAALQQDLGIKTGVGLLQIPVKFLKLPTPTYRKGSKTVDKANWNLVDMQFPLVAGRSGKDQTLYIIDFRRPNPADCGLWWDADDLGKDFLDVAGKHGLNYNLVKSVVHRGGSPTSNDYDAYLKQLGVPDPTFPTQQVILVLLDSDNAQFYGSLKTIMETQHGISTICTVKDKMAKPSDKLLQTWGNIALKLNIKTAGKNHEVMNGKISCFASIEADIMVIGADLAHNDGVKPSVAAVVASHNNDFTTMLGSARLQPAREEIINKADMTTMVAERIMAYIKKSKKLPRRILYYRDGVDESRYRDVLKIEADAILRAY